MCCTSHYQTLKIMLLGEFTSHKCIANCTYGPVCESVPVCESSASNYDSGESDSSEPLLLTLMILWLL